MPCSCANCGADVNWAFIGGVLIPSSRYWSHPLTHYKPELVTAVYCGARCASEILSESYGPYAGTDRAAQATG